MNTKSYLILLLSIALVVPSWAAFGSNKNKLSSETAKISALGTSFKVPNDWFKGPENARIENLKKMDSQKEQLGKLLANSRGTIKAYTYYKEDPSKYPGVIPSINMMIRQKQKMSFDEFTKSIEKSNRDMAKLLNNYSVVQPVNTATISGKEVVYFISEFDLHLVDGSKRHIRNITYVIPYESTLLQVSMSEEKPAKTKDLFTAFINSFEFNK